MSNKLRNIVDEEFHILLQEQIWNPFRWFRRPKPPTQPMGAPLSRNPAPAALETVAPIAQGAGTAAATAITKLPAATQAALKIKPPSFSSEAGFASKGEGAPPPEDDWLSVDMRPASVIEEPLFTPSLEPWVSPRRAEVIKGGDFDAFDIRHNKQLKAAAEKEEKLVSQAKNNIAKLYTGPKRDAWLEAGVPAEVYDEIVIPRIIQHLNKTNITITKKAPTVIELDPASPTGKQTYPEEMWAGSGGLFWQPENKIFLNTSQRLGALKDPGALSHEFGHRISLDPFLAAVYNRYRPSLSPTEKLNLVKDRGVREMAPMDVVKLDMHGKDLEPISGEVASGYYPLPATIRGSRGSYISHLTPRASMAKLQSLELDKLIDLRHNIAGIRGYIWQPAAQLVKRAAAIPIDAAPTEGYLAHVQELMDYATNREETFANVIAIGSRLGRKMRAQDVMDVAEGVVSKGSQAIESMPQFRDFMSTKVSPKEFSDTFNKILGYLISIGVPGAAALGGGEDLKESQLLVREEAAVLFENKKLFIVKEEFQILLEGKKNGPRKN